MNITSRQLKAFVLTARHQSFSRAAEQLYITQSGMSVLVRELETQLGFRLFERTTRKVTLTEFGQRFLPIADRSLLELESAASAIGRSASAANGGLALGASPFSAAEVLPRAIAQYGARDPALQVRLVDAESSRLLEMLHSGELDVVVTAALSDPPGVQRSLLAQFPLVLISSRAAAPALPAVVRWIDVAAQTLVGFPEHFPIQQIIDAQLERRGRRGVPDVLCHYLETQIAMVEVGAGMAVIPTFALPACAKRNIAVHAIEDPVVSCDFYWWTTSGRRLSPAAEGFNAFLRDYLNDLAHAWRGSAQAA